jgi:hypothetical protein
MAQDMARVLLDQVQELMDQDTGTLCQVHIIRDTAGYRSVLEQGLPHTDINQGMILNSMRYSRYAVILLKLSVRYKRNHPCLIKNDPPILHFYYFVYIAKVTASTFSLP